jgi:hypothetical protein
MDGGRLRRVAVEQDEVRALARFERADQPVEPERSGSLDDRHLHDLPRRDRVRAQRGELVQQRSGLDDAEHVLVVVRRPPSVPSATVTPS